VTGNKKTGYQTFSGNNRFVLASFKPLVEKIISNFTSFERLFKLLVEIFYKKMIIQTIRGDIFKIEI
jgi:hypothetical protein